MAGRVAAKTGTDVVQQQNDSTYIFPDDVLNVIFSNLNQKKDVHSLLLTSRHINKLISDNNVLWGNLVASYFPYSFQSHTNASNYKDVFKSLQIRDANMRSGKFRTSIVEGPNEPIENLAIHGNKFVYLHGQYNLIMRDLNTRDQLFELQFTEAPGFYDLEVQGDTLYCSFFGGDITTWNANTGEKERTWKSHNNRNEGSYLTVQGDRIISRSQDAKTIKISDQSGKELWALTTERPAGVFGLAVHGDKLFIGLKGFIEVWDLNSEKKLSSLECRDDEEIMGLIVQGDLLFSSGKNLKLWDISSEKILRDIELFSHDLCNAPNPIGVQGNIIFYAVEMADNTSFLRVVDLNSGKTLYKLQTDRPDIQACIQDGKLIYGCLDGRIIIRDFNFPSLSPYDGQTLEENLVLLEKMAEIEDKNKKNSKKVDRSLCNELHPDFSKRLLDLTVKSQSYKEAILHVKIEVGLQLLLDRIHLEDQKRILELFDQLFWNETAWIDDQSGPLYAKVRSICIVQEAENLGGSEDSGAFPEEQAMASLQEKEQAVLDLIHYLKELWG